MAYSVRCYFNTGLNAVNIYDSPSRLEACKYVDLDALNILQDWGLSSVRVRVPSDTDISTVDYIKVGSYYYVCSVPVMVATDVAQIDNLTPDYITSNGGINNIQFLDGITERHTVNNDDMFAYTQEDEYMTPNEPLQLVTKSMYELTADPLTVVEATINLYKLGNYSGLSTTDASPQGLTFYDTATASTETENKVTVPVITPIDSHTQYQFADENNESVGTGSTYSAGTKLFPIDESASYNKIIQNGIACTRSLGIESAIIRQVQYDGGLVTASATSSTDHSITVLKGKGQSTSSELPFKYATVNNNRLLYGEYNKYGLITATGDKGEYRPEQINDGNDSPNVKVLADPRPDGKPYFRYASYNGDSSSKGFFLSCLSGMQWKNVPLVYSGASGSYLDRLNFENSSIQAKNTLQGDYAQQNINQQKRMSQTVGNNIGNTASLIGSLASGKWGEAGTAIGNIWNNEANDYLATLQEGLDYARTTDQYNIARQKELQNFYVSQYVVAPEVVFPFNAEAIRDFIGNGVLAYRYRYSDNDLKRIDKLLTMYGYKDTVALTSDLFFNRQYFDYVRASGVSIGGDIPIWQKTAIAQQLNAGVRVWHTKPDTSHYSSNPISTT